MVLRFTTPTLTLEAIQLRSDSNCTAGKNSTATLVYEQFRVRLWLQFWKRKKSYQSFRLWVPTPTLTLETIWLRLWLQNWNKHHTDSRISLRPLNLLEFDSDFHSITEKNTTRSPDSDSSLWTLWTPTPTQTPKVRKIPLHPTPTPDYNSSPWTYSTSTQTLTPKLKKSTTPSFLTPNSNSNSASLVLWSHFLYPCLLQINLKSFPYTYA